MRKLSIDSNRTVNGCLTFSTKLFNRRQGRPTQHFKVNYTCNYWNYQLKWKYANTKWCEVKLSECFAFYMLTMSSNRTLLIVHWTYYINWNDLFLESLSPSTQNRQNVNYPRNKCIRKTVHDETVSVNRLSAKRVRNHFGRNRIMAHI